MLVGGPAVGHAVAGLACLAEQLDWPWRTACTIAQPWKYRSHLVALRRT